MHTQAPALAIPAERIQTSITRLQAYRLLRLVFGPLQAHRLAFGGRHHG